MNALIFLLIALVLSGIGSAVLVFRNRRPTSVESGIDEFRREMNALAPPQRSKRPRQSEAASAASSDEPVALDALAGPTGEATEVDQPVEPGDHDDGGSSPADPHRPGAGSAKLRPPDDPGTP